MSFAIPSAIDQFVILGKKLTKNYKKDFIVASKELSSLCKLISAEVALSFAALISEDLTLSLLKLF